MARQIIERDALVEKIWQYLIDDSSTHFQLHLIPRHPSPVAKPPGTSDNEANWTLTIDPSLPLAAAVHRAVSRAQQDFDLRSPFLGASCSTDC
jgi:hypothetical protein